MEASRKEEWHKGHSIMLCVAGPLMATGVIGKGIWSQLAKLKHGELVVRTTN